MYEKDPFKADHAADFTRAFQAASSARMSRLPSPRDEEAGGVMGTRK